MRRFLMGVALMVGLLVGGMSAFAQKDLTKDPLPFPADGAGWAALSSEEVVALIRQPGGLQDFAGKIVVFARGEIERELGPQISAYGEQISLAWENTLTRVITVVLGGLLLWWPHRFHFASWFFIGIVVGVVVAQTEATSALMLEVFPDEPAMRTGILGILVAAGLVALISGVSLGFFAFVLAGAAGWLAGALIGADVFNSGVFNLAVPEVYGPAIVMSILTAIAFGRSSKLIAAVIGAALVVAALRLSPSLIPLIGIGALAFSLIRTQYAKAFKRENLESLTLSEGKVNLGGNDRKHLHGLSPEMKDDSANSPFKAL